MSTYKLCPHCDQPMKPKGVKKRPGEYDHAQGCPNGRRQEAARANAEIARGTAKEALMNAAQKCPRCHVMVESLGCHTCVPPTMTDEELTADDNWCPSCGDPREACRCREYEITHSCDHGAIVKLLLRVEAGQRDALQKRLAGRKRRPSREVFEDFGVPTLNEEER